MLRRAQHEPKKSGCFASFQHDARRNSLMLVIGTRQVAIGFSTPAALALALLVALGTLRFFGDLVTDGFSSGDDGIPIQLARR